MIAIANIETATTMKVMLSLKYALECSANDNGFSLVASDGTLATISDVVNYNAKDDRSKNFTNTLLITLS